LDALFQNLNQHQINACLNSVSSSLRQRGRPFPRKTAAAVSANLYGNPAYPTARHEIALDAALLAFTQSIAAAQGGPADTRQE